MPAEITLPGFTRLKDEKDKSVGVKCNICNHTLANSAVSRQQMHQ